MYFGFWIAFYYRITRNIFSQDIHIILYSAQYSKSENNKKLLAIVVKLI